MNIDIFLFLQGFLYAFFQNLWIGFLVLLIGLVIGVPFAIIVHYKYGFHYLITGLITVLRSLPVFIAMFIILGILTMTFSIDESNIFSIPVLALIGGLCFSSISGSFDATLDYLHFRDAGEIRHSLLIIPNTFRLFISLASTTAVGAAIGVKEVVYFALTTAELFPNNVDRLILVLFVSLFFVSFVLSSRWLLNLLVTKYRLIN
jgi:ABC-type amino acid transport system permease subunit